MHILNKQQWNVTTAWAWFLSVQISNAVSVSGHETVFFKYDARLPSAGKYKEAASPVLENRYCAVAL